jgi:hypothetical protein
MTVGPLELLVENVLARFPVAVRLPGEKQRYW